MKPQVKAIVSICLLGSSLFAGSFSFAEMIFPQQSQPKQDISVFIEKLASRLQGVFGELVGLSQGIPTTTSGSVQTGTTAAYFEDIQGHLHEEDINILVQYGVVDPNRSKFYPDNYLRRYEMAIMYVKYQLVRGHMQLPEIVFPSLGRYSDVAQNASFAPYVAYGTQQHRFTLFVGNTAEGSKTFKPNAFLKIDEILRLMNLPVHSGTDLKLTRGEFAHLLVKGNIDGLYRTIASESFARSTVDTDAIADSDSPVLDGNQVLSTLKTMFALVK